MFRTFTADLTLETKWDWTKFLLFGVVINNSAGTVWDALTLNYGNVIKTGEVAGIFSAWLIGSILVIIGIVPLAGRFLIPKIQKSKLFEKKLLGIRFFTRQTFFFLRPPA